MKNDARKDSGFILEGGLLAMLTICMSGLNFFHLELGWLVIGVQ